MDNVYRYKLIEFKIYINLIIFIYVFNLFNNLSLKLIIYNFYMNSYILFFNFIIIFNYFYVMNKK